MCADNRLHLPLLAIFYAGLKISTLKSNLSKTSQGQPFLPRNMDFY